MFLAKKYKEIVFCSALRADFLFKCGWLRDRCRSLEWIECWRLQDFRFGFLECLCFSVQQISTVVSRFCFCCCQGRPGIPLHCCTHVGVSCWANTVVTFVCVPVHPSYTLAPGQSLQSLLFKSTPSHASKDEIHEVCSLSALPTAFSISCVFTLLALLKCSFYMWPNSLPRFCRVFVPTGSRFLSPELARSSLVRTQRQFCREWRSGGSRPQKMQMQKFCWNSSCTCCKTWLSN